MESSVKERIETLTDEQENILQADQAVIENFGDEGNAEKTAEMIQTTLVSFENKAEEQPLVDWVIAELAKHPQFADIQVRQHTAKAIINEITVLNEQRRNLAEHIAQGKKKESWIAKSIESGAQAANIQQFGDYASQLDAALKNANDTMLGAVTNQNGAFSQNRNLHGFAAEAHHTATFNMEAVAQGSNLRAVMLDSTNKNSVDIVIKDNNGTGNIVRRYGAKYGKDQTATESYFKKGDYRGQRKLGPAEQQGHETRIEADGIKSKPLSYKESLAIKEQAQIKQEIKAYKWDQFNKLEAAKCIGQQTAVNAGFYAVMQGGRILGQRVWNKLTGKKNPPASEAMEDFLDSSYDGAKTIAIQTAVSTGALIAARNGWIKVLQNTPAGKIANIAYVGMENAKVLYKVAKGELTVAEGMDQMHQVTLAAIGGLYGAGQGALLGATLGTFILPGVGTVIGGFIGSVVGGIAGSAAGSLIHKGVKVVNKVAKTVIRQLYERSKDTVKGSFKQLASIFT